MHGRAQVPWDLVGMSSPGVSSFSLAVTCELPGSHEILGIPAYTEKVIQGAIIDGKVRLYTVYRSIYI